MEEEKMELVENAVETAAPVVKDAVENVAEKIDFVSIAKIGLVAGIAVTIGQSVTLWVVSEASDRFDSWKDKRAAKKAAKLAKKSEAMESEEDED